MAQISIIIPVYNVEQFISECLQSIQKQTFKAYEVIMVDDGSTDNSGGICKHYSRTDRRFKYLHQENAGVSAARNRGLDVAAAGEYIAFVDPDDYLSENWYENLFNTMCEYNADIVEGRTSVIKENGRRIFPRDIEKILNPEEIIVADSRESIIWEITKNTFNCLSWNKLFTRQLWGESRFPEDLSLGEDMATVIEVVSRADKAVYNPQSVYFYRNRSTSLLHSGISVERFQQDLKGSSIMRNKLVTVAPDMKDRIEELKTYYDIGCLSNYLKQSRQRKKSKLLSLVEIAPAVRENSNMNIVKEIFEVFEGIGKIGDKDESEKEHHSPAAIQDKKLLPDAKPCGSNIQEV